MDLDYMIKKIRAGKRRERRRNRQMMRDIILDDHEHLPVIPRQHMGQAPCKSRSRLYCQVCLGRKNCDLEGRPPYLEQYVEKGLLHRLPLPEDDCYPNLLPEEPQR